ncbi:MAG: VOC family protein [Anaerolineae bacterium]
MHIIELHLKCGDLAAARAFYEGKLGLTILEATADALTIQAGRSRLVLEHVPGWQGKYHFAFDVPENQIEQAQAWVARRAPAAVMNDQTVFHSPGWNAHMTYFYDPAGNILECIARHNQPNASDRPFDAESLLHISEIGLATISVQPTVNLLCDTMGLEVYDGQDSDSFSAVGDENGLFIVPKQGRIWFPQTGVPAELLPVQVKVLGKTATRLSIPSHNYEFQMVTR